MACRRGTGRTQGRRPGELRLACIRRPAVGRRLREMGVGSRMRETRSSGSEKGRGTIVVWLGSRVLGCGDSLINTQEAGGGSPADLAKKSGPGRQPPPARGPALLALTAPA